MRSVNTRSTAFGQESNIANVSCRCAQRYGRPEMASEREPRIPFHCKEHKLFVFTAGRTDDGTAHPGTGISSLHVRQMFMG